MSGLVDKLKPGHKGLQEGAKLPQGILLKENNPEKGTVDLASLSGKSESTLLLPKASKSSDASSRHHSWRAGSCKSS